MGFSLEKKKLHDIEVMAKLHVFTIGRGLFTSMKVKACIRVGNGLKSPPDAVSISRSTSK